MRDQDCLSLSVFMVNFSQPVSGYAIFAYFCSMPVSLLEHIISQSFVSVKEIEAVAPSEDLQEYIDSFYVFPCCNLADTLAYNDGTPMLAFLPMAEDRVELEYNNVISSFNSGWFSTRSFARMSIRLSGQVPYLLIVRFKPASFYRLSGLNARYFNTRPFWNLKSVLGGADALLKDMQQCTGAGEKIQLIETYLRGVISTEGNSNKLLDEAIHYIRLHKGMLSIDELKSHLGVNYKWLERNFSEAMGMTPKQYSSLQRFINAYTAFLVQKDLSGITAESGYSDTNHFIKDFKKYTGETPMQYLRTCKIG